MKYGICTLSIVPCREDATDTSEMVTQLLFGETYRVTEERKKWVKIRGDYDGYVSWIDRKQYFEIEQADFDVLSIGQGFVSNSLISLIKEDDQGIVFPLVMGSILPNYEKGVIFFNDRKFSFDGEFHQIKGQRRDLLIETAFSYLNTPYLWGGRSPFGIDCSGFSQIVYRMCGIYLPRDAHAQAKLGVFFEFY